MVRVKSKWNPRVDGTLCYSKVLALPSFLPALRLKMEATDRKYL